MQYSDSTMLSDSATAAADEALRRLSDNIATLLHWTDHADAFIIVKGKPDLAIPVHRCVLSARSPFFQRLFSTIPKGKEPRIEMGVVASGFNVGVDALHSVLAFVYSGRAGIPPRDACVCVDGDCLHLCCRPALDFALGVLFTSFKFEISELVSIYQEHLLEILKNVVIEDVLLILSVVNMCNDSNDSCKILFTECVRIVADSDLDMLTLDKALPEDVVKQVIKLRPTSPVSLGPQRPGFPNANMKKIYSALDSNDFELIEMLLAEGHTSLDDACALHYAVSYCHEKIVTTILDRGMADVNRRNARGYTVLHCAAIRKEPVIIISVLAKGARPSEVTPDGRTALQILKRLTKYVDYKRPSDEVKAFTDDHLCIDMLEEAERKDPLLREPFVSHPVAGEDLRDSLLYLENRVIFAKFYFPFEAKLAMKIAGVDGTLEFVVSTSLSETRENLPRKEALSRTVALGRYFFPRCSAVLDNLLDNEGELNEPEQRRYLEILADISMAI
ncbi:BTB/POZ domain and ankyrin repeat-containing protein NPR1-like [Dioscorea cayenensis subsp. rotundata]|uniref:BTB/POZ domain and ankyrin repeat-containing protein NPR1-like n=1 Tax=Dioscorea cayennensis subsp. rotundata TaxID=55577 RepID=A0AB40B2V7_DIOCR|nr:BTB/POZ domain and ankyrin repeat-containing protein NPR1-like [Dioscorea cayenensis subsp. rotundata]